MLYLLEISVVCATFLCWASLRFADRVLKKEDELAKLDLEEEKSLVAEKERRAKLETYARTPGLAYAERVAIAERRRILQRRREHCIKNNLVNSESRLPAYQTYDDLLIELAKEEAEIPVEGSP